MTMYKATYNDKIVSSKTIKGLCKKLLTNGYPTDREIDPLEVREYYEDHFLFLMTYIPSGDIWYKVEPAMTKSKVHPAHDEVRVIPPEKREVVCPEYVFPDGTVYGEHTILITVPAHQVTVKIPSFVESVEVPEQMIPMTSTQGLRKALSSERSPLPKPLSKPLRRW